MVNDELAGRRAVRAARSASDDPGWHLLSSEAMEACGEHIRPEVRGALDDLSAVDRVLRFWAEGGCQETGGAHVPDRLLAQLAQAVIAGLGVLERQNGGPSRSARELALWVADLHRSSGVHPPATVKPADERIGTAEAARILRCSQHHVWILTRRRTLDAQRVGRVLVLRRRQVIELAERNGDADDD
jgi:hypothetical protein